MIRSWWLHNRLVFTSLLLLFCILTATGQDAKLIVTVVEKGSGNPVEFANILITPCSCGGVTDAEGNFEISLPKKVYEVVTSFIGYRTDTSSFLLLNDLERTITLDVDGVVLNDVVVSGKDPRDNLEKTVMGVQQLDMNKIKMLPTAIGEVDIFRSLTMLSGVSSAGEASNGLSVRGGSLDQNLVLLDDAPVFNTTHLFGLFSVFTPEAVRGVDLYQANMPPKYGGRISSIVDVKVQNPSLTDLSLRGGVGLVSSRLAIEAPLIKNKLSVLIAGRASFNDFLFRSIKRLKNTKANFLDGTTKVRYQINDKNSLNLTTFYSRDLYQLDINSKIKNITSETNVYDYLTFNNTLTWTKDFGGGSYLKTSVIRSLYLPKVLFPQADSENELSFKASIKNSGLRSEFYKKYSDKLDFSVGVQAEQTILSPGELTSFEESETKDQILSSENGLELSAFGGLEWSPSERISVSAGLRYSYFLLLGPYTQAAYSDPYKRDIAEEIQFDRGSIVQTYNSPEPRLGLRYKLSEQISVKASYALTRQYIQNIYNSSTPLPTSRWKLSDVHILPQTGNTYSVGYFQNFRNNLITFGIEGYYRSIKNVLDYKPGADFFLQEYVERDVVQGTGENYGLEFNVEKSKGKYSGWANYTWSRSLRKFDSDLASDRINNNRWFPSDFDRPHVFNGTLNVTANSFNTFSFNFTYQTGRPYTIPSATIISQNIPVPIFLERNNSRLPDYHRLDFSWRITNITTKKTRWTGDWIFTIYNLYNRDNAFNIFYAAKSKSGSGPNIGNGPLAAYQLSIFSSTLVSLGYNFTFK